MAPKPNNDETIDDSVGGSMREDFEAAIKAVDESDKSKDAHADTEKPAAKAADEASTGEAGDGKEDKKAESAEPKPIAADAKDAAPVADADGEDDVKASKAPAGWSVGEREHWESLPTDVKARITKREKEMTTALEDGNVNRKLGQRYADMSQKYQATFAAEGYADDPSIAIEGLVKIVTNMRFGSPQQKAQHIANFIKTYNVDVGLLDDMIVGAPQSPEQAQNSQIEQMLDQRMAPVNQLLQSLQTAQTQRVEATNTKTTEDVNAFAAANPEFINDVSNDMADLMDMAVKRNSPITLQQAYDKACAIHPEINKVLAERAEKERIMGNNADIAAKHHAASSIQGDQGGSGAGPGDLTLRQEIEQQFG